MKSMICVSALLFMFSCGDEDPFLRDGIYSVQANVVKDSRPFPYSNEGAEVTETWELYSNDEGICFRVPNTNPSVGSCGTMETIDGKPVLVFRQSNEWNPDCGGCIRVALYLKPSKKGFKGNGKWHGTLDCNPGGYLRGPFDIFWVLDATLEQTPIEE